MKERSKCRICSDHIFNYVDFTLLNFVNYKKSQKSQIKTNRQHYKNLMNLKKSKRFFFKQFEKFHVNVFDYLYDFLNKGFDEEENDTFYCDKCKMTINCAKKFNFLTLPEVLTLGFDYNMGESNNEPILPFKLDLEINLSYLLSEDNENNEGIFTKYLSTINDDIGHTPQKAEQYKSHIYKLKGAVQLVQDLQTRVSKYIQYINIKDKWYIIENGEQKYLKDNPIIIGTNDKPIVMCHYERIKVENSLKRNIRSQLAIGNSIKADIQALSLPDEFVFKLLYLSSQSRPSLDFYLCQHKQLKPLFQDIYGYKRGVPNLNNHSKFLYSDKKKFNKELKEYRTIRRTNTLNSPDIQDENIKKSKNFKHKLRNANTVEFSGVISKDNTKLDCSYARLHYLTNSLDLPKPVSEYLVENFNYTIKGLSELKQENYAMKCNKCTNEAKRQVLSRILQKALLMDFLCNNKDMDLLVDICWFKNYKLFLFADMSNDNLSKELYNCNYISEPFNVNIHSYYTQFRHNYVSTKEMVKNEFVAINSSIFEFLKEIYGCEQIVKFIGNDLEFLEPKECKLLGQSKLSSSADLVFKVLKRLLGVQIFKDNSKSQENVPHSAKGYTKLLDTKNTEEILMNLYNDLLIINKKMNAILKAKLKTVYSILENDKTLQCEVAYKKNLNKLYKYFGTNNIDAIDFRPCELIKELIEGNLKLNTLSELHSIPSKVSIDKNFADSQVKVSNVIKSMNDKAVNEFYMKVDNKQKNMRKTRSYLENLEMSIAVDKKENKADEESKPTPSDVEDLKTDLNEMTKNTCIDREALFSKDNSFMVKNPLEKNLKTNLSKFKNNHQNEPKYIDGKECIKYINHDETDNQPTNRSNDNSNYQLTADKREFDYNNILDLDIQNSFSQELDINCSDISQNSHLKSISKSNDFIFPPDSSELPNTELVPRDESREEDITLDSNSDEQNEAINIEIQPYDSNEDFKPHKSIEGSLHFERKFSQMPSKRSHFSRMGSVFVTDNSDSEDSSEETSMHTNILTQHKCKDSVKLARRNTKRILYDSINHINKENAYTIKVNRIRPPRNSFLLVINKTPKTSNPEEPINLIADEFKKAEEKKIAEESKNIHKKYPKKHIAVIRESTFESFEESTGEDHNVFYENYISQIIKMYLTNY